MNNAPNDMGHATPAEWGRGIWLNEPRRSAIGPDGLTIVTDRATDFWRETHYGFVRDSGHFLGFATGAEFTAQMRVRARYDALYDQAGFMLRATPEQWVKTGVEFTDGALFLSTVVTDGRSDWSVRRLEGDVTDVWLRLTLRGGALRIQASTDRAVWPLLRLAPFAAPARLQVGPMCCTPERDGLEVRFSDLTIGPALTTDLHDLG